MFNVFDIEDKNYSGLVMEFQSQRFILYGIMK